VSRIAVDIDSTLYDFESIARDAFFRIANDREDKALFRGAFTPWVEWRSPDDACGTEAWLEAIRLAHNPSVIMEQRPYSGAAETIQGLVESGHSICYLSDRDEKVHMATERWLREHEFPINRDLCNLICTRNKTPHMADCQYIIDDRPKTLVEFVYDFNWARAYPTKPRLGFGLHHEYNRALTDLDRLYLAPTWGGLNHYLMDKGLLEDVAYKALGIYS
jgi:hypothetical protein